MAGVHERYLQAAADFRRRVIRDRPQLDERAIDVAAVVERLDLRLTAFAPAIEIDRVFFLDLRRVAEHHRRKGARGRRAVDRAAEALTHEIGEIAAVVEVGMAQDDAVDVARPKWEVLVAAPAFGTMTLEQPAIEQQRLAARLDLMH
jgi:hypothetical protein